MNDAVVPPIILASNSPRRRELLASAGYKFEVRPPSPEAESGVCSGETAPELVARLARQKAQDVAARCGETDRGKLILAADTLALCRGQVLGKPEDEQHAAEMLRKLCGRRHEVYTGLCLWPLGAGEASVRVDRTILEMDALKDADLDEYVASGGWQGKAGAFGYQDRLGWLRIVEGSESNVVGLPLELLQGMLAGDA